MILGMTYYQIFEYFLRAGTLVRAVFWGLSRIWSTVIIRRRWSRSARCWN